MLYWGGKSQFLSEHSQMPQTCKKICWCTCQPLLSCTSSFCTKHLLETFFQWAPCSNAWDLEGKEFPKVIHGAALILWHLLFCCDSCFCGWGHCQALCPVAGPASTSPGAATAKQVARVHRGVFSCFEWVFSLVPPSMQGCLPGSSLNKWISFWN